MGYEWAPSAARHGISRDRVTHLLDRTPIAFPVLDEDGEPDPGLFLVVGEDPSGVPLEVLVRRLDDDTAVVFHAMKMRPKYRALYERARR